MSAKHALSLLLILATTAAAAADEKKAPAIQWAADLEAAMKQSAKDGRPVIAYFTFNACVWCKRLEKACFYDPDVVKLSRQFIWVKVNRDNTPEIPKRLNVFAYPSLLTLGKESENVYRFQSYQLPPEFIGNLKQALKRYDLYKQGKDWMLPPQRPESIIADRRIELLTAPTDDVPGGIASMNDVIWVAQGELYKLDAVSGKVLAKHSLPASVGDLCTDGKMLYAVTYGWTAGRPIYVIDPSTGKVTREIITEANKKNRSHGAKGIAWRDGRLYVLSGMVGKVFAVNIDTGAILDETQLEGRWLAGLDFQGDTIITGGREHLWRFEAKTGKLVRKIACNYPLRNVAAGVDSVLLMEQPIFGFGRKHERIQVWPQETKIYRVAADN